MKNSLPTNFCSALLVQLEVQVRPDQDRHTTIEADALVTIVI